MMPGSVKIAPDSGSLQNYPFTEFAAYTMPYTREGAGSEYTGGSSQRFLKANASKRRWRVAQRLTADELQTMRDFYKTHLLQPFNFVDRINDTACKAVFTGTFQETWSPGYYSISVELSEVV
jgi:hypothetical protein